VPRTGIHPGKVLRDEFMVPLGLNAANLARELAVSITDIREIIRAENPRSMAAGISLRLAYYFGTTPEFWLNLQAAHDISVARAEHGSEIARDVHPRIPLRDNAPNSSALEFAPGTPESVRAALSAPFSFYRTWTPSFATPWEGFPHMRR
jgi:addiction module HigA family antidote